MSTFSIGRERKRGDFEVDLANQRHDLGLAYNLPTTCLQLLQVYYTGTKKKHICQIQVGTQCAHPIWNYNQIYKS